MSGESQGGLGEPPEAGGLELEAAVRLEEMAVEAVQQHDDQIGRIPFGHVSLPGASPLADERLEDWSLIGARERTGAEAGVVPGGRVVGSSLVESATPPVCLL
jgi:hypothetical protein